jgi:hypothetical protein
MLKRLLGEIEEWKLEAKLEDVNRYFFHTRDAELIEKGLRCYVIGRKGTGKTAIAEYLHRQSDAKRFSKKLSFKNFPFNDLYTFKNESYNSPNQYITFWKYIIYSSIAQMMVNNENIDSTIRDSLSKIYAEDPIKSLPRTISKWTSGDVDLTILGSGIKVSTSKSCQENVTPWIKRVEILEDIIAKYIDDASYFVIFDELDEDYKDIVFVERYEQYTALLTSLFKAVQDIKSLFPSNIANIFPIIFLRDDIYDILMDPDKTKWRDLMIEVNWDEKSIKPLLAFRLSRAANSDGNILIFKDAWNQLFNSARVSYGHQQQRSMTMFNYITRSTHIRPRDYIRYLQACATESIKRNYRKIDPDIVVSCDRTFSNYFRSELEDEIHGVLPDIGEVLNLLSYIKKQTFRYSEFEEIFQKKIEQGAIKEKRTEFVLQVLFNFSIVGNQPSQKNVQIFRFKERDARFIPKESICIHRGLLKALQII